MLKNEGKLVTLVVLLLLIEIVVCNNPFQAFCTNECNSPMSLYPIGDERNFPSQANYISRSTPDGIHRWPVGCVNQSCLDKIYEVLPRVTWWDNFESQKALPTNTWFIPYFSTSPYNANPNGWAWYAYTMPFSSAATQYGFLVDWPIPQQPKNTVPGAWQSGDTPPQVLFDIDTGMFNFSAVGGFAYERTIEEYDENGLGISLLYHKNNGGTVYIPVFRGSPFMTFVYWNATPMINMTWGVIRYVNGIDVIDTNVPYTQVMPNTVNGLYTFDLEIYYNTQRAFQFRLYTGIKTSISVGKINGSSIYFDQACTDDCVVRMACTYYNFEDPDEPSPFYTSQFMVDNTTLDDSANMYPIFPSDQDPPLVSFTYDDDSAVVTFQWPVACILPNYLCEPDELLMMALPHHSDIISTAESVNITYPTMMGESRGYLGNNWTLTYSTSQILGDLFDGDPFYYQNGITNSSQETTIITQLKADLAEFVSPAMNETFAVSDCYAFGKYVAAIGRLVIIAQSLGATDIVTVGKMALKDRLNQWLDKEETLPNFPYRVNEQFVYDTTWGGIAPQSGLLNLGPSWMGPNATMAEFGSGAYNDHLFHYGYFLYAVATVLHDGDDDDFIWWDRVSERVLALARDIANPNSDIDPYFPQFRHKSDWYVGHSWASGLYPSGAYPNIESTSEGLNAWYSLYLLGYTLNQNGSSVGESLMAAAKFLLETDLQSFRFYSHLWVNDSLAPTPMHNLIYPSEFSSLGIVGNLWGGNAVFQTFFSYGTCEWVNNQDFTYCPKNRSVLTSEQIRYFNTLFILGINVMPFTPLTQLILSREWLGQIFDTPALSFTFPNGESYGFDPRVLAADLPDIYNQCSTSDPQLCDGWIAYAWQIFGSLGGLFIQEAWDQLTQIKVVSQGSTLSNALHFVASQPFSGD